MLQPILTVIEGGNPDDQFTDSQHLTLVSPPAPTLNVTIERTLGIKVVEALISLLANWLYMLEMHRVYLQRLAVVSEQRPDEPKVGGRGW